MLFNSLEYAIFLPVVFAIYWLIPHKFRWILLLASSYYFYMSWNANYVVLILFTTTISYVCSRLLEVETNEQRKKMYLAVTLCASWGVLFFFKYFNFFSNSICAALNKIAIPLHPITINVLLPVGISFYTFQTLSYVIDVYRGNVKPEHHFGKYATFISFFPQLVAGPIERTSNLLPQIIKEHKFSYEKATYGMKIMAWGFFKKVAVADTLAIHVDKIYGNVQNYKGFTLLLASMLFAIQIYCDFSGYSEIAIGTAKLFDIDLMRNFKSPYISASIKEFWSKWHISLSTWFKDYLYIPLGGNRKGKVRHALNLIITFLVSGLWHGANWTYVIWGAIHGIAQVLENSIKKLFGKKKKKNVVQYCASIIGVFLFCTVTWIFFRANTLRDAIYVLKNIFVGMENPIDYIKTGTEALKLTQLENIKISLMLIVLGLFDIWDSKTDVIEKVGTYKLEIRWMLYVLIILLIILFVPSQSGGEFIYFQF